MTDTFEELVERNKKRALLYGVAPEVVGASHFDSEFVLRVIEAEARYGMKKSGLITPRLLQHLQEESHVEKHRLLALGRDKVRDVALQAFRRLERETELFPDLAQKMSMLSGVSVAVPRHLHGNDSVVESITTLRREGRLGVVVIEPQEESDDFEDWLSINSINFMALQDGGEELIDRKTLSRLTENPHFVGVVLDYTAHAKVPTLTRTKHTAQARRYTSLVGALINPKDVESLKAYELPPDRRPFDFAVVNVNDPEIKDVAIEVKIAKARAKCQPRFSLVPFFSFTSDISESSYDRFKTFCSENEIGGHFVFLSGTRKYDISLFVPPKTRVKIDYYGGGRVIGRKHEESQRESCRVRRGKATGANAPAGN